MKVALIGPKGQLGSDLLATLTAAEVVPIPHAELDICDAVSVRQRLADMQPRVVINTAAFHKVEECEEKSDRAFQVNAVAVGNLARVCAELDCALVHISTDYVFGSHTRLPHGEDDPPCPLNVYGVSKLAGEYMVRNLCPKHFLVRTSGLYGKAGASGKGGNFVELMVRLAAEGKPIRVVNDQVLTPTYTRDLAQKIQELIRTDAYGLYHVTSSGQCSWYDFAARIFQILGLRPELAPTTTAAFGNKVQRPAYSVLAHRGLISRGFDDMRPWPEALQDYLREKGHLKMSSTHAA